MSAINAKLDERSLEGQVSTAHGTTAATVDGIDLILPQPQILSRVTEIGFGKTVSGSLPRSNQLCTCRRSTVLTGLARHLLGAATA